MKNTFIIKVVLLAIALVFLGPLLGSALGWQIHKLWPDVSEEVYDFQKIATDDPILKRMNAKVEPRTNYYIQVKKSTIVKAGPFPELVTVVELDTAIYFSKY